jgi:hypothetical protein
VRHALWAFERRSARQGTLRTLDYFGFSGASHLTSTTIMTLSIPAVSTQHPLEGKAASAASNAGVQVRCSNNREQAVSDLSSLLIFHQVHEQPATTSDVEEQSALTEPDPYDFRAALKDDQQLSELRKRRKTGKRLEKFHTHQNEVPMTLRFLWRSILTVCYRD